MADLTLARSKLVRLFVLMLLGTSLITVGYLMFTNPYQMTWFRVKNEPRHVAANPRGQTIGVTQQTTPYSEGMSEHHTTISTNDEASNLTHTESSHSSNSSPPIIYLHTKFWVYFDKKMTECSVYNDCEIIEGWANDNTKYLNNASVVMSHHSFLRSIGLPHVKPEIRGRQIWMMKTIESPGYGFNHYDPSLDGQINMTISYRRGSSIVKSYHPQSIVPIPMVKPGINYKKGKTKGAFAYVSNCNTYHYDRLAAMRKLGEYIDVDIFGTCGSPDQCKQEDFKCEAELHSSYHFFLSFENSLCQDYITEKFWKRLANPAFFIPIAIGGVAVEDYTLKAPPNSFLHAYNFTSLDDLGLHLKHLMQSEADYNFYHKWRESYSFTIDARLPACQICELAHKMPSVPAIPDLSSWWNDPAVCRTYDPNKSSS